MDPEAFADLVDQALYSYSGRVFYSGRSAFGRSSRLYLLGLNPGGSPTAQANETIERDLAAWRSGPERWSAYEDECWRGASAGTYGMQPRISHLFRQIGHDPRDVPASNVIFMRSAREADLTNQKVKLLDQCWQVHRAVIDVLSVSTILCLGGTAGRWVRANLRAHQKLDEFVEDNERRWKSEAHLNGDGLCVVTVTHPGIADWRNPRSDPSPLVYRALQR